ncbi:MAG TPA: hypothetical protein VD970_05610 [Acetobacteraceae bacterium]|nr:hypothetical protein [Acetobacteraceae bacterium]
MDRSLERAVARGFRAVWRHKFIFAFTTLVALTAFVLGILALQPVFEGSTLLVSNQQTAEPAPSGVRQPVESPVALARIAESEEVIREAIERVGTGALAQDITAETTPLPARLRARLFGPGPEHDRTLSTIEAILPAVKRRLSVRSEPNSGVIRIAYRHRDPVVATDFVNAVAQAFVDRQIALYSRAGAAEFFQRQRQRFEQDFAEASAALERFSTGAGIYAVDEQRELLLGRLNELAAATAQTRGSIVDRQGQRQALAEQLRRLAPVARSPYVSSLVDLLGGERPPGGGSPARGVEERTGDPPLLLVRVYQDSMVALFRINAELAGAQNLLQQQTEEQNRLTAELNRLSRQTQEFQRLRRAVELATHNADLYSRRTVEEQINAELSAARLSSLRVLQRATEPLRPVFPNYRLFFLVALVLSALLGLSAALLRARSVARDVSFNENTRIVLRGVDSDYMERAAGGGPERR